MAQTGPASDDRNTLSTLVRCLAASLMERGLRVATAESCSGGLVAAACTAAPGSSRWFECGIVAYSENAKARLLGVQQTTLRSFGMVSEQTAREMAEGVLVRSGADLSVSVTGVAGPGRDVLSVPVGTIWFAWARRTANDVATLHVAKHGLGGDRERIRQLAVSIALSGLLTVAEQAL